MKVMIDPAFPRHRKLRKLSGLLGISLQEAAGYVMFLWCEVIEQAPSGVLAAWDGDDVEHSAGWKGQRGRFADALRECDLLDVENDTLEIHEWAEHQGDLIQKREQWRDRQRKLRESRISHQVVTKVSRVTHASPILPLPSPSFPIPPKESHKNDSCPEPSKTPLRADEIPKALRGLSLYETDRKLIAQYPALVMGWRVAYPGVDVEAEITKAHAWELANPKNRKINRPRFLNAWLAKAQDQPRKPQLSARSDSTGKTLCLNCGGSGTVAGGVENGSIKMVPCQQCQRKAAMA